jgi:hypothetical protein
VERAGVSINVDPQRLHEAVESMKR